MDRPRQPRSLLTGFLLALLLVLVAACQDFGFSLPSRSPDPNVAHAIEVRGAIGLRNDQAWVESVIADPASVTWNDIHVTAEEFARLEAVRVADLMHMRQLVGLPADEATVRELLRDPAATSRDGIPMTAEEADAWDSRVKNQAESGPRMKGYGQRFPDEWAGLIFEADGTAVAMFTDHLDEHRTAIAALFVPGTIRFDVRHARWSLKELEAVRERLRDHQDWFASRDIDYRGGGVRSETNTVEIDIIIPEPRPGIEDEIARELDAVGKLKVNVEVRPPWTGGHGEMTVAIVDESGEPVPEVDCVMTPFNPAIVLSDWDYMTANEGGVCHHDHLPATAYRLVITRGFQGAVLATRDVLIPRDGKLTLTVRVIGG